MRHPVQKPLWGFLSSRVPGLQTLTAQSISATVSSQTAPLGNTHLSLAHNSTLALSRPHGSQHENPRWGASWWPFAAVPLAAAATATALAEATQEGDEQQSSAEPRSRWGGLLSLGTRQRVFFKYEKRIRDNSSLDKVFDYFSSQQRDGIKYMQPQDLLRAIVPTFPASRSTQERAGALPGERQPSQDGALDVVLSNHFFKQFDVDGDGLISYVEFLLMLSLLSIPKHDVHVIFGVVDVDGNGLVDAAEFDMIMQMLQSKANALGSKHNVGRQSYLQQNSGTPSGLLVAFFGADQKGKLKLGDFRQFLTSLHGELIQLEFAHYMPDERGCIPGIDFARSLVAAAKIQQVDGLLNKVDGLSGMLSGMSFSFAEFNSIYQVQLKLAPLTVALDFYDKVGRPVTKSDLEKLVRRLTCVQLTSQVLDVIMAVFDNGRGGLDVPRFLETVSRREHFWERRGNQRDVDAKHKMQRLWDCLGSDE